MGAVTKPKLKADFEAGIQVGFRSGWAAACITIAEEMRKAGATGAAASVEGWRDHAPDVEVGEMKDGETPQEAIRRGAFGPEKAEGK